MTRFLVVLALAACGARTPLDSPASDGSESPVGSLRQIAPLSTTTVTTQLPTFRWTGPASARVEVCRDRACSKIEATVDGDAHAATLTSALAPGVHFYRLRPLDAGKPASATTPVWEFRAPHRSSPRDTSWGVFPDFDGDGRADVVVAALATSTVTIVPGSPSGLTSTRVTVTPSHDLIAGVAAVGDVDGDGFGDLAIATGLPGKVNVYRGGPSGIDASQPSFTLEPPGDASGTIFGNAVASAGDLDGDGYADMLVVQSIDGERDGNGPPNLIHVFFGGPEGPSGAPAITLHVTDPGRYSGVGVGEAGDVDGDGFPDVVVLTQSAQGTGLPGMDLYRGSATGPSDATRTLLATLPTNPECFTPPLSSTPGDLNGDGFADVVVGVTDCVARVTPGQDFVAYGGPTTATSLVTEPPGFDGTGHAVHIAWDVDGDGFDDLVAGASTGTPSGGLVYWGSATGVSDAQRSTFGASASADPDGFAITASDVDGDGLEDVSLATLGTPTTTTLTTFRFAGDRSALATTTSLAVTTQAALAFFEPFLR